MKRLALFALSTVFSGCAAHASAVWVAPPPPPPPSVAVEAQPATVQVDVTPAPEAAPEELVATSEPPEPIYEEQDDMPSAGMYWVPGYWQWTGNDWGWYYGGWNTPPEGRIYIAPYYEHVDDHVVYVRGYWGAQGEEPRYYGGDRIVFTAAIRPEGYVRGVHAPIARSTGLPPGRRASYGPRPANVKRRPLPTATAPRLAMSAHGSVQGHAEVGAHSEATHAEATHAEAEHAQAHAETQTAAKPTPAAKPEPRPQPQPKPAPKPHRK